MSEYQRIYKLVKFVKLAVGKNYWLLRQENRN